MLLDCGEAKVLAEEEEQRVEQDSGGVCPQLFTVPQKLLLHTGQDTTCQKQQAADGPDQNIKDRKKRGAEDNLPPPVTEGLRIFVNSVENLS